MNSAQLPAPQLGQILIAAGLLTEAQLAQALEEQTRTGRRLGEIIVRRGFISGPALANALAEQHGGVLKTEYGFATGLGGQVAQKAASDASAVAPTPLLRTADPAPQLRGPEPPTEQTVPEPAPPPEAVVPPQPVESPASLAEPPAPAEPEPAPVAAAPDRPLDVAPTPPPEPAPAPAPRPEPEPEPQTQSAPQPAQPVAAEPDERDRLIESLRARIEAQEAELAKLRAELGQERAQRDVEVRVWPEEEPVEPEEQPVEPPLPGPAEHEHYLICVPTTSGYVLLDRIGQLPAVGQEVPVPEEEGTFTVTKVVRLPRNGRPCAYLQRA